jgi:hypothetical protein
MCVTPLDYQERLWLMLIKDNAATIVAVTTALVHEGKRSDRRRRHLRKLGDSLQELTVAQTQLGANYDEGAVWQVQPGRNDSDFSEDSDTDVVEIDRPEPARRPEPEPEPAEEPEPEPEPIPESAWLGTMSDLDDEFWGLEEDLV